MQSNHTNKDLLQPMSPAVKSLAVLNGQPSLPTGANSGLGHAISVSLGHWRLQFQRSYRRPSLSGLVRYGGRTARAGMLATVLALAGCASPYTFVAQRAQPGPLPCYVPIPQRDMLVGVALSGGGSRAALFGAASLEAMAMIRTPDGRSLLGQASYLSSVSGGSIAASYYVANKPPRSVPLLTPEGAMTADYRAFFDQYKETVSQSIGPPVFRRQIGTFRWINPALGAVSLHEILQERVLGKATLMDLAKREANGDAPGLIINTTLYNNGRRLAISGHSSDDFDYEFIQDLEAALARDGRPSYIPPLLAQRWHQLLPMTPHELNMNPCNMPVSAAVSGSASFPPFIGPITFRVEGETTYWHAGDGGLYENQGLETLLFMFLKQLQEKHARRALILAFDSSFPFAVGDVRLNRRAEPFGLLSFDFSRIPSIMEERATTYRALFFRTLQLQGVLPSDNIIEIFVLRHIDAVWAPDLSDLPDSCRKLDPPLRSSAEVRQRLAEIPTRLKIMSACDHDLLTASAAKVIEQNKPEILRFINASATTF